MNAWVLSGGLVVAALVAGLAAVAYKESDEDTEKTEALVAWLRRKWVGFKRFMRKWGWFVVSGLLAGGYAVAVIGGWHTAGPYEKLWWLGLPAGAAFMAPFWLWAISKLWTRTWYFYDKVRGDDSEKPREVWKANDEAQQKMKSERHPAKRLRNTEHPAFEVMDIDPDEYTVIPTYRGEDYDDPDAMRRNEEEIGRVWKAVDEDGRMWRALRDYFPAVIRALDRERAERQAAAVEQHTIPNIGGKTVDETIRAEIPDELLPDSVTERGDPETEDMEDDIRQLAEDAVNGEVETEVKPHGPTQG